MHQEHRGIYLVFTNTTSPYPLRQVRSARRSAPPPWPCRVQTTPGPYGRLSVYLCRVVRVADEGHATKTPRAGCQAQLTLTLTVAVTLSDTDPGHSPDSDPDSGPNPKLIGA